jgi:site-specific DNA recombinase
LPQAGLGQHGEIEINAIIYARVTTDEQAEKGYSLQSQIERCREFARAENLNIVAEITDDYSGETLDRPGFVELESMLARKEANAVIAVEEDHLSRNAANTLALYNDWPVDGISLGYSETGWVNFSEESILINGVPILVAQYERVQIRKRTMNGRRNKAKSGKPVLSGVPPYGYRKQGMRGDAVLVMHEDELNIVRLIFEWYTKGNGTGGLMSSRKIAQKLNRMPSAAREKGWSNVAVSRILDNEINAGTTY